MRVVRSGLLTCCLPGDSLYILLRPHTMAGGFLQWPLWKPYEIYAAIDHVYGQPGWDQKDGFGGGQGAVNAIEVVLYGLYMMIVYNHGVKAAGGSGLQIGSGVKGWASGGVRVRGSKGNVALIIGFTASVMTLSKTVLYCASSPSAHPCRIRILTRQIWSSTSRASRTRRTTTGSHCFCSTAS